MEGTQWLAVASNQVARARCALSFWEPGPLTAGSSPASIGIGCFEGTELLLRRLPRAGSSPLELRARMSDLRSDRMLGAQHDPSSPRREPSELEPLRADRWLFASRASPHAEEALEARLRGALPAFVQRALPSPRFESLLFGGFLHALWRAGAPDQHAVRSAPLLAVLAGWLQELDAHFAAEGRPPPSLELCLLSDRWLLALAREGAVSSFRRHGVRDCAVCRSSGSSGRDVRRVDHEHLRFVLVGPGEVRSAGWQVTTAGAAAQVLLVTPQLEFEQHTL